jgi:hypothetical protein
MNLYLLTLIRRIAERQFLRLQSMEIDWAYAHDLPRVPNLIEMLRVLLRFKEHDWPRHISFDVMLKVTDDDCKWSIMFYSRRSACVLSCHTIHSYDICPMSLESLFTPLPYISTAPYVQLLTTSSIIPILERGGLGRSCPRHRRDNLDTSPRQDW